MPKPGDIGFTRISGVVGWFVHLGQWFNGDKSKWTHVFVVLHNDMIIEAQPGGAVVVPLVKYLNHPTTFAAPRDLTQEQRDSIVAEATLLKGTPYSFADYFALTLERLNLGFGWTRKYVRSSGHMICSQLADESYKRAGVNLFDDGRLPQDVTPGDLARLFKLG